MQTWWIFFLILSQQSIQNWLRVFSPLKHLFMQKRAEIFYLENWNFSIEILGQKENRLQKTKKRLLQFRI